MVGRRADVGMAQQHRCVSLTTPNPVMNIMRGCCGIKRKQTRSASTKLKETLAKQPGLCMRCKVLYCIVHILVVKWPWPQGFIRPMLLASSSVEWHCGVLWKRTSFHRGRDVRANTIRAAVSAFAGKPISHQARQAVKPSSRQAWKRPSTSGSPSPIRSALVSECWFRSWKLFFLLSQDHSSTSFDSLSALTQHAFPSQLPLHPPPRSRCLRY